MNDISLRDYFAAHAPDEPWPEFQPVTEGHEMTSALYTNDRRTDFAEFAAADYLPTDMMRELTAAIDGVVAALRYKEVLP